MTKLSFLSYFDGSPKLPVNPWWLAVPLYPLAGLGDYGSEEELLPFEILDTNNENVMRELIRNHFVPYVHRIDADSISKLKRAYQYYLSQEKFRWESAVFDTLYMPFECPRNARSFFLWIWEECFPSEEWLIREFRRFFVDENLDEPNRSIRLTPETK